MTIEAPKECPCKSTCQAILNDPNQVASESTTSTLDAGLADQMLGNKMLDCLRTNKARCALDAYIKSAQHQGDGPQKPPSA